MTMDYARIHASIERGTAARDLPRWTRALLRDVADGRAELTAVRHPLGFLCFPVQRAGARGVCVHLWSPGLRLPPSVFQVHSHSWDLASYVLHGALRNELVGLADSAGPGALRVFAVRSRGEVDELHPTGRLVSCHRLSASVYRAGSVYALPTGEFHATALDGDEDVATVVLGRRHQSAADFTVGPPHLSGHTVRRARCDPEQTAAAARLIAARLAEAGDG